ncbi:hypothetical protein R1flu_016434 [Riccia fluitans]|uniref:Uncharacterized protein n=1 Tax=Riccia fluitans TaxID=41844 RepID=A0ABD1YME5_9MARC
MTEAPSSEYADSLPENEDEMEVLTDFIESHFPQAGAANADGGSSYRQDAVGGSLSGAETLEDDANNPLFTGA